MSGKKGKQQPLFRHCSKCQVLLLSSALDTHLTSECPPTFPSISTDSILNVRLGRFASKNASLPILKSQHSDALIFIPEEIILEMKFVTHAWVFVQDYENPESEIALRIWPISKNDISSREDSFKAFLSEDGFIFNPTLNCDRTLKITLPKSKDSSPFQTYPCAKTVYIDISKTNLKVNLSENGMEVKLLKTIQNSFKGRIVTEGNRFQVKFYSELVGFTITDLVSVNPCDSDDSSYYEITGQTEIKVGNPVALPSSNQLARTALSVQLEDVGGSSSVIKDFSSTILFVLQSEGKGVGPMRGILLAGHHGTGKTLLIHSICKYFGIQAIFYKKHGSSSLPSATDHSICTSLESAFNGASVCRTPSAVILEDLETLDSEYSDDGDSNGNLLFTLRTEMDRLDAVHAKVFVFATTSNLDAIDPGWRSSSLFGRELEMPIPTVQEREEILVKLLRKSNGELNEEESKLIAASTHGFVGADIRALLNEAAIHKARHCRKDPFDMKDVMACLKRIRPSAMNEFLIEVPNVKWTDIGGQEVLKYKLRQAIEWPLKFPESFTKLGITPPKGFLMYGPPGCSKTMIAKAIATESGLNFISAKGSEIFSKWVGESEKAIQNLFRKAREVAPTILFFDEIDALGVKRGNNSSSGSSVNDRVLSQLLVEIDGIESLRDVTIIAATNRPDIIDQALIRPGRLDRIIYVPLPDAPTRKGIVEIQFKKMPVDDSVSVDWIVSNTEGYSGAEITAVCQEAGLNALEEDLRSTKITANHFKEALTVVKPRTSAKQIAFYEEYSKNKRNFLA